jgi:hypothetical protein
MQLNKESIGTDFHTSEHTSDKEFLESTAPLAIDKVRVNKCYIFVHIFVVTILAWHFGYSMSVVNPNIETFIVKFNWDASEKPIYISLLSFIVPLGAVFGTPIAKTLVRLHPTYRTDLLRETQSYDHL